MRVSMNLNLCEDCEEDAEGAWALCEEDIHCLECCPDDHWI